MACWPVAPAAMDPSKGSVMNRGSMSAAGHLAGGGKEAGQSWADEEEVAVAGRGGGEGGPAHAGIGEDAFVGDGPAVCVQRGEDVSLD